MLSVETVSLDHKALMLSFNFNFPSYLIYTVFILCIMYTVYIPGDSIPPLKATIESCVCKSHESFQTHTLVYILVDAFQLKVSIEIRVGKGSESY